MKSSSFRIVSAIILVVIMSGSAAAQTFMFKSIPEESPKVGLRFMRPSFDYDAELSTFSGIYDLRVNLPINERWSIDASFPLTRYTMGEDGETESFVGNIYGGLQYIKKTGNKSSITSFGVYFPTGDDDLGHLIFGTLTNNEDMFKYYPEAWTLYGNFAYINISSGGARLGLEIGPDLLIPTGDGSDDPEFLMHYGLTAGYRGERFAAITELIGMVMLTEEFEDTGDRFIHSIDFGASYISPRFIPGVFYKIYLKDEFSDLVDGVFGVSLEVVL